jgi:prolyl oligopeptidase
MEDKYSWLENSNDPKVVRWARKEDRLARRSVRESSNALFARLLPFYRRPIMRTVQLSEAGVVLFLSDDKSYRVELLRPDGTRERIADSRDYGKDAIIQAVQARKDGRAIALYYSEGGSDEGTVAIIDLGAREVTDELHGFIGGVHWLRGTSYYYVRTFRKEKTPDGVQPPSDRVFLRQGRKDEMVFGAGLPTNTFVGISSSHDGGEVLIDVNHGWSQSRPYAGPAGRPGSWAPVYPEVESIVTNVDSVDGAHLLLSFESGCGEVLEARNHQIRKLVRERRWPLQEAALLGDRLLCHYLEEGCSKLGIFTLRGRLDRTLAFPLPGSLIGPPNAPGISALGDEAVVAFSSFALPFRLYRLRGRVLETLASEELPGRYSVAHRHAISSDGTRVHYFVASRKDATPKKALLVGYGGFRISMTPTFNPAYLPLLEDGIALAVANLRGGLERGEAWHRAGMRDRKSNVFNDYLAILARMNRQGMGVVGFGRSNGGLLMGATMNSRPEFFAGVLIGYPVLDMLAFHRLLVGRAWVPEYGDPDNPIDRAFLLKYSPYHNLSPDKKYPPVFIYTGLKDDRVHPSHAFKFYSKLKDAGKTAALRVETKSGHIGTTPETRIREEADKLAFVYQALGVPVRS